MADDPWAAYRSGKPPPAPVAPAAAPAAPAPVSAAPGADPWAAFRSGAPAQPPTPPAAASPPASASASSAPASSYDPSWKPSGNAIWDLLTRPVAKTENPLEAARDYGLSAYDAATFGYGVPNSMQPSVAQAHANLGLMDPVAESLGYAVGPGKILGPLARGIVGTAAPAVTGASKAAQFAGSVGAGALEGTTAGGLGAAGHGGDAGDIALGAGVGALGGAASGAFGGSGPKPKVPDVGVPQSSTGPATGMYGQKVAAYAPLDPIAFNDHGNALNQAQGAIRAVRDPNGLGVDLGIPKDVNDIVTNLSQSPIVSGRNLQQAGQDLRATGDWTGHRFADAIDTHLATAQPISINGVPTGQVGEAGAAKMAGDTLYGRINDLERLGTDPSQLTPGAVSKTASFYQPSPGAQPGPPAQSLTALQNAMQPPFNPWHIRHMAAPLVGAALGGAEGFFNPAEKQNPWLTAATQGLEGAALFSGVPAAGAALGKARTANALNAARYAIATGQPLRTTTGQVGDALSNLILGRGATNQWPY
jgi:hypothetical protein